jgi:uncharacterized protein (TIGR02452 family)
MMERAHAARLGRETVALLSVANYRSPSGRHIELRAALDAARQGTVEYPPGKNVPLPTPRGARTVFSVENDTVLAVGRRMSAKGPVAALNFASATTPGGGFLDGARAQEESIARSSGLYTALERCDMYRFHGARPDAMYTNYVIYSPEVPVFRTDMGELLDNPWPLSVVTSPAVNGAALARYAPSRLGDVDSVMSIRAEKVLSVAAAHGVRRFILGAWGCGAFGLRAEMMAQVFRNAFGGPFRAVFDEIVFAVTDWSADRRFIQPFVRAFGENHDAE